jgi:hypothetical protein
MIRSSAATCDEFFTDIRFGFAKIIIFSLERLSLVMPGESRDRIPKQTTDDALPIAMLF